MGIFAVYDTTGIQSYIFASNKLRENVGASILVCKVLKEYLSDIIKVSRKENSCAIIDWERRCEKPLEIADGNDIYAEIIYVGGGNAYVAFKDYDAYEQVTKKFLLEVYDKTAGIGIASAFVETNFKDGYSRQFQRLQEKLSYAKGNINHPIPAGNQPITTTSLLTGLPVTISLDYPEPEWLSEEQFLKRNAYGDEHRKIYHTPESEPDPVPKEFSDLERGNSFLAVIHLDGNNMGKAIMEYSNCRDWSVAVPRMRKMSSRISNLYVEAFNQIKMKLARHCKIAADKIESELPLIKIIGDGDDITCVVSGQYGISFAAQMLGAIETLGESNEYYPFPEWESAWPEGGADQKPRISACAGVTLFHSHYPFSEAYKMAEECCANAKRYTRNAREHTSGIAGSFIDFHLHQSGAVVTLNQLRNEQYTTEGEKVICRPYCVSIDEVFKDVYPAYRDFERLMNKWAHAHINILKDKGAWPRSRLIALRQAIRIGHKEIEDVKKWCESRGFILPEDWRAIIAADDRKSENNGNGGKAGKSEYSQIFDVLEFSDIYEDIK